MTYYASSGTSNHTHSLSLGFSHLKARDNPRVLQLHARHHPRLFNTQIKMYAVHNSINKSDQSNLGRGPRPAKVNPHWLQWRAPKYPFPWTDPQTPLRASSLDPSNLWCQTASVSDPPFFPNALDRSTHAQTDRSSTGTFDDYSRLRV